MELTYRFSAELWEYPFGETRWIFVTLPEDDTDEIDELVPAKRGFGSVKVTARIGATEWSTSIFPDKARASYILPVKKAVRKAEQVTDGDTVEVTLRISVDAY